MGQYWMAVNIDKCQILGGWGKLGECFFDGSPSILVDYLAVPSPSESPDPIHGFHKLPTRGDWAGDRVIFIGDYAKDIPEGVLSDEEIRRFARMARQLDLDETYDSEDDEEEEDTQYNASHIKLYDIASQYFKYCRHWGSFSKEGFSKDKVYVLRNLTKHEYVRADALNLYHDELDGPFVVGPATGNRPGLGEVLLSRISWSTDSTSSMPYGVEITRGAWAGDRFDIATIDAVAPDSADARQWEDVSKEVAEEVFAIYTAKSGESWRKRGREQSQPPDIPLSTLAFIFATSRR